MEKGIEVSLKTKNITLWPTNYIMIYHNRTILWPIFSPGYTFKKFLIQQDTCTSMFIAALFVAKICKEPKCPSADELIKMWYTHTKKGILLGQKKESDFAISIYAWTRRVLC